MAGSKHKKKLQTPVFQTVTIRRPQRISDRADLQAQWDRREKVYTAWLHGVSPNKIAEEMGISRTTVRKDIDIANETVYRQDVRKAYQARTKALSRYEIIIQRLWGEAMPSPYVDDDGETVLPEVNLAVMDRLVKVMALQANVGGYDRPDSVAELDTRAKEAMKRLIAVVAEVVPQEYLPPIVQAAKRELSLLQVPRE